MIEFTFTVEISEKGESIPYQILISRTVSVISVVAHLFCLVVLGKSGRGALGQLFELRHAIVVAAEETRVGSLRVRPDRPALVDAVKTTNLLFVTLESVEITTINQREMMLSLTLSQDRAPKRCPQAS